MSNNSNTKTSNFKTVFMYLGSKLVDMIILILGMRFVPQVIYQLVFHQDYQAFQQAVTNAGDNQEVINQLAASSQYLMLNQSIAISLVLLILIVIVLPILIFKRPLGELLFKQQTFDPGYSLWKVILFQPALWFSLAVNLNAVILAFNGGNSFQTIATILKFVFMAGSLFTFITGFNRSQGLNSWGSQPTKEEVKPVAVRHINEKPKVKEHKHQPHKKHKKR